MTPQPHVRGTDLGSDFAPDFANDFPTDRTNRFIRRATILLVEDEQFVREATCSILERGGFEVRCAENAQAAMSVFQESKCGIDLVMTDMILPGLTGQQLGHDLQLQSPGLVVLITSGYFNPEYDMESPGSQTYFLAKPYSKRTLLEKIDGILGASNSGRVASQAG